jgi:lipoate-protein ligase B
LLLVEHPPVITLGRRPGLSKNILAAADALERGGVEVVESDRGGDVTFHGPGQLVAYPIVRLADHRLSVGGYVRRLQEIVIATLNDLGVPSQLDPHAIGVWTCGSAAAACELAKICAIGVRIRRGVSMHGLALNVTTDLRYFELIVPCGLSGRAVTSLAKNPRREDAADGAGQSRARRRAHVRGIRLCHFPRRSGTIIGPMPTSSVPHPPSSAMTFASFVTEQESTADAVDQIVAAARESGVEPDVAFLFFTAHHRDDAEAFVERIWLELDPQVMLGCSGEGVIGGEVEIERAPGMSLLLGQMPRVRLHPFHIGADDWRPMIVDPENSPNASPTAARRVRCSASAIRSPRRPGLPQPARRAPAGRSADRRNGQQRPPAGRERPRAQRPDLERRLRRREPRRAGRDRDCRQPGLPPDRQPDDHHQGEQNVIEQLGGRARWRRCARRSTSSTNRTSRC